MQQVVSAKASMLQLVSDLRSPMRRDAAMVELLRRKEWVHDLGPALWNTCGVMAALLDEIFDVYRLLDPPALSSRVSYRVCNVLGLFRAIAASPQTQRIVITAQYIPALIPLLQPPSRTESYENVRVATMEIIIELLKYNELAVVSQLLSTEMIPLALRMMTEGSELAQSYSTFIILKILQDNFGLSYVCNFRLERVEAVAQAVSGALGYIAYHRSSRLLRYSLQCYLQLCDHILARDLLRRGRLIPQSITDGTLWNFLAEDDFATKSLFERLLDILSVQ
ncbi:hypothetical protein BJ742DRAFT_686352 [Cladochytrium replicatum]|nr:hypothetical protein BJ742DRAFT_686352 [Cladochytrium replicatum]